MGTTLKQLVVAIRNAESLEDLNRLHKIVGPSDEELEASKRRVSRLMSLISVEPDGPEWRRIMLVQDAYEAKYL